MGKERVRVAAAASVEASAESTRARSAASGAAAREAQLRSYLAAITGKAFANNQNNVTLMSLEREAETTRELYLSLVRSEEHTSELQSLMRISYTVVCLKNKNNHPNQTRDKIINTDITHKT